jgi:hypothetical protein
MKNPEPSGLTPTAAERGAIEVVPAAGVHAGPAKYGWLQGGGIALLLTALTYIYTYAYEAGYCKAFDIPVWFIRISASTLLAMSSGFALVLGPLIVWYVLRLGQRQSVSRKAKLAFRSTSRLLPLIVLLVVMVVPFKVLWVYSLIVALAIVVVAFAEIAIPIRRARRQRLHRPDDTSCEPASEVSSTTVERRAFTGIDPTQLLIIFLLGLGVGGSFLVGHSRASRELRFLIPTSNPDRVVLRIYENRLICAPFDRAAHTVERVFYFTEIPTDGRVALVRARVGPLKSVEARRPLADYTFRPDSTGQKESVPDSLPAGHP